MRIYLAAVQTRLDPAVYQTPEAFRLGVEQAIAEALSSAPLDAQRIVAFPELFGLPLLFWMNAPDPVFDAKTTIRAALQWLSELGPRAIALGPWGFYRRRALEAWPHYREAFVRAARKHRAYVFAGTWLAPTLDQEPGRGVYPLGLTVRNWGFWVNPHGSVLARPEKLRLMPEERKALVRPGSWGGQVIRTELGTLATLICLDAFHETLVERIDAAGAWLVVQPSANPARWEAPWRPDPRRTEGEVWLTEGLAQKLKGREHLRYGLNPMLVGDFYELHFEGTSNVAAPGAVLTRVEDPTTPGSAGFLVEL